MAEDYYFEGGQVFRPELPSGIRGGAQGIQMAQGMEVLIRDLSLAGREIRNAANDLSLAAQRQQQMYGLSGNRGIGQSHQEITQGVVQAVMAAEMETVAEVVGKARDAGRAEGIEEATRTIVDTGSITPVTQQVNIDTQPVVSSRDIYEGTRSYLGDSRSGLSLANLRRDLAIKVQSRLQNMTWGEQLLQGEDGNWYEAIPTPDGGVEQGSMVGDAARIAAFMNREKIMGAGREFTRAVASGQSMKTAGIGVLGTGAARALGVAGAGLFAAQQIGDFFEGQRAANAQYQSIYGGSNLGAAGERIQERLFGMSQFGVMGGQQAEQLFQGVAQTGLRGDDRSIALSFATDAYKSMGMSVAESLRVIQIAAQTGQESLLGVAESLQEVTDSAAEAGINTQKAREQFVAAWGEFSALMGGGPEAAIAAQAQVQSLVGLGREYQGISQSIPGQTEMRRMAYASGFTNTNQFIGAVQSGDVNLTATREQLRNRDIQRLISPTGMAIIQRGLETAERDANGRLLDATVQNIANELLNTPGSTADVYAIISHLRSLGGYEGVDERTAMPFLVRIVAGEVSPSAEEERIEQAWQPRAGGEMGFGDTQRISGSTVGMTRGQAARMEYESGIGRRVQKGGLFGWFDKGDSSRAIAAYLEDARRTDRYGGISEALVTTDSAYHGAKRLKVQTKDGPRVVTIDEAMQHFRDQVDAGTAEIVEGDMAGQTVAEALKATPAADLEVTSTRKSSDVGMSAEEWDREARKRAGTEGGGGVMVLGLTDEAKRIFVPIYQTMGVSYDESLTPGDPYVTPNNLPSGNPGPGG